MALYNRNTSGLTNASINDNTPVIAHAEPEPTITNQSAEMKTPSTTNVHLSGHQRRQHLYLYHLITQRLCLYADYPQKPNQNIH